MDKYEIRRIALKSLVEKLGHGGITRLAKSIGKEPNYISRMLYAADKKGMKRIGEDSVEALDKAFPGWLTTNNDIQSNSSTPPRPIRVWDNIDELDEGDVLIPALMLKLSAGKGEQVFEIDTKGRGRAFQRDYIDRLGIKPGCAATMSVSGNSMGPRIEDGDSVLVDYCRQTILDGKVYAFVWQDEYFIKRVFKEVGGGLRLVSDNQDKNQHPDRMIPPDHIEEFRLIGQVVGLAGGKI